FPDRERVLLIYQGVAPLAEDDGTDVDLLMPALDTGVDERPMSHYEAVLARRLDPDYGPLHVLLDDELLPAGHLGPWESLAAWDPMRSPLARNQHARAASMRAHMQAEAQAAGLDAQAFDVALPPDTALPALQDLPSMARQAAQAAQEARIDMLHARRQVAAQIRDQAGDMPAGMNAATLLDSAEKPARGGPPTLLGHPGLAELQALASRRPPEPGGQALDDASVRGMMKQADDQLRSLYLQGAHLQPPADAARPARAARMRRRVQSIMAGSRDLSGLDLTGADLSGLDLRGARCAGTMFEGADLSGARLDGADLTRAVLARVRAQGGSWRATQLHGANLGSAVLRDIDFGQATMADCELTGLRLSHCRLAGLAMKNCALAETEWTDCCCDGASFDTVTFWQQARLTRVSFANASMTRVSWVDCVLDEAAFGDAQFVRCSWVQSHCVTPPDFTRAQLTTCCAVMTDMDEA